MYFGRIKFWAELGQNLKIWKIWKNAEMSNSSFNMGIKGFICV